MTKQNEDIINLIEEANKNCPEVADELPAVADESQELLIDYSKSFESAEDDFLLDEAIERNRGGVVLLGNYLNKDVTYTITGRKKGKAVKERYKLSPYSGKWIFNWDYGISEILIIQTDDNDQTDTFSPAKKYISMALHYNK